MCRLALVLPCTRYAAERTSTDADPYAYRALAGFLAAELAGSLVDVAVDGAENLRCARGNAREQGRRSLRPSARGAWPRFPRRDRAPPPTLAIAIAKRIAGTLVRLAFDSRRAHRRRGGALLGPVVPPLGACRPGPGRPDEIPQQRQPRASTRWLHPSPGKFLPDPSSEPGDATAHPARRAAVPFASMIGDAGVSAGPPENLRSPQVP